MGWAWLVISALLLVDLVVRGKDFSAVVSGAVLLITVGVAYVVAIRPKVVATEDGVRLVNPLREVFVPWSAFTWADVSDVLRVHADDQVFRSWAVRGEQARRGAGEPAAAQRLRGGAGRPASDASRRAGGVDAALPGGAAQGPRGEGGRCRGGADRGVVAGCGGVSCGSGGAVAGVADRDVMDVPLTPTPKSG